MSKILISLFGLFAPIILHAQNNAVFNGGQADGWGKAIFAQSANSIYSGGIGDGWNRTTFSQSTNSIFVGGIGDGWHQSGFAQPGNQIFNGGIGDGWDSTAFAQAGNLIYTGGIGDGWSSTYRPMGPLPIHVLSFTAQKKNNSQGLLLWQTSSEQNSAWFEVERSFDAVNFEFIGRVAASGSSNHKINYSYIDLAPHKGYNYYRLKMVDLDGSFSYTPARVLLFDQPLESGLICFPNPSTGKFEVALSGFKNQEKMIINICDSRGVVIWQEKLNPASQSSRKSFNLSGYPKGIYLIQAVSEGVQATGKVILQ